jgi:serine/threonine protein kinase
MKQSYQHALPVGTHLEYYEIRSVLGVGGFGVTYRAYDHHLQCDVAIKEYLPSQFAVRNTDGATVTPKSEGDASAYEYGLKRFLDEARTLAKFREPNIVRVIRYLETNHTAYFVMDFEEGESLGAVLTRETSLGEERIKEIVIPILDSLRSVHIKNILHRDIKPANIYLRGDGSPVLLDFGSARHALEQQGHKLTGVVTPGYAPFEQYFSDSKQGPWTDIYAIGATMYHCVTGVTPAVATERIALIQDKEPDPVVRVFDLLRNRCSASFLDTLRWMLEPNARDRPQTAEQAANALLNPEGSRAPLGTKTRFGNTTLTRQTCHSNTIATGSTRGVVAKKPVWLPETLHKFELTLEPHVGPVMSKVLVRKASAKAHNVEELARLLADILPSQDEKTTFLSQTQTIIVPPDTAPPRSAINRTTQPPSISHTPATLPISGEQLKRAEEALAIYLGPFARVLVKNAARKATNINEFHQLLAAELPGGDERHEFMRAVSR